MDATSTQELQVWLDRLRDGDQQARGALVGLACQRLTVLTRKMFHDYPPLRRWMQTDDVFQNATLRLHGSLADVVPRSVREFYGLAALQIRRELRDLIRHYYGRQRPRRAAEPPRNAAEGLRNATEGVPYSAGGPGGAVTLPCRSPAHLVGIGAQHDDDSAALLEPAAAATDAGEGMAWEEFHKSVDELPAELREVFDLLWYQELTVEAAADVLGVDPSTVKRRMARARIRLAKVLKDWLPER